MGNVTETPVQQIVKILNELKGKELTDLEFYVLREAASWLLPNSPEQQGRTLESRTVTFDVSEQNL